MQWYQVAQAADLDSLSAAVPANYQNIPVGKRVQIIMNTSPFPIAPLFDVTGAEFAARLLAHQGKLIDVSGNGLFEIVFEIEATDTSASTAQLGSDSASMAFLQIPVAAWIAIILGLLILAPLITKVVKLFANYIPSTGTTVTSGIVEYLKAMFGDYWWLVVAGGAVVLFLLLKPDRSQGAPVIYNIEGSTRRRRESDESED